MGEQSDTISEDGEKKEFDYEEFFSVLFFYAGLSKEEIMHSSRAFLNAVYRKYVRRACENLGVSGEPKAENETTESATGESDYPSQFRKMTPRERKQEIEEYTGTEDFLSQFSGIGVYKNLKIEERKEE